MGSSTKSLAGNWQNRGRKPFVCPQKNADQEPEGYQNSDEDSDDDLQRRSNPLNPSIHHNMRGQPQKMSLNNMTSLEQRNGPQVQNIMNN